MEEGQAPGTLSSPVKEKKKLWDKVSTTVKAVKDGIGGWYDVIPEAVKLAIVAETHLDQWMFMTGQLQQSSEVEGGQLQHFWTQYERYMDEALDWVSESLPGALSQMSYSQNGGDGKCICDDSQSEAPAVVWCLTACRFHTVHSSSALHID